MSNQNKLIQERSDNFFTKKEDTDKEIFRKLTLYIYSLESGSDNDLYMLAKILSKNDLNKLINYYNGEVLKLPNKEEKRRCNLLAIAFYLKEIYKDVDGNGLTWTEIKKLMALPENDKDMISSISLGRRINEIKENLKDDINVLLRKLKCKEVEIDDLIQEAYDD